MDLIVFHQLFNLRHLSNQISHLGQIHFVGVGASAFLRVIDDLLEFLIDFFLNCDQMSVAEPNPEVILLIQIDCSIVCSNFTTFGDVFDIVNNVLVKEIVLHRCYDIEPSIDDEQLTPGLSRLALLTTFLGSFEEFLKRGVYLSSQRFAEFRIALVHNVRKFIIDSAYCQ